MPFSRNNLQNLRTSVGIVDDPVQGCIVTASSTPDMNIHVASGKYKNLNVKETDLTIESITASPFQGTMTNITINTGATYIVNKENPSVYSAWAINVDWDSVIVKDHTTQETLVLGTDYTLEHTGNYLTTDVWAATKIKTVSGSKTVDISYNIKKCRVDIVAVNTATGAVSLIKGTETTQTPWTSCVSIPDGYYRLAHVFVNSEAPIASFNIVNIQKYNYGLTALEWFYLGIEKQFNAQKLSRFWQAVESSRATGNAVNIGIIGDSVINGSGLIDNAGDKAWFAFFADLLHAAFPNAQITYTIGSSTVKSYSASGTVVQGARLKFNIKNYAQGGHTLFQFMHDGDGHFDKNAAGSYSVLYDNQVVNNYDLVIFARTNTETYITSLKNTTNFGTSGQTLYSIYTSAPYNLSLHDQADYNDATNGTEWLAEDNLKCFKAELQYIYDTVTAKRTTGNSNIFGADFVIISGTPDSAYHDMNMMNDNTSSMVSAAKTRDIVKAQFAKTNNLVYINLWPYFKNLSARLGLPTSVGGNIGNNLAYLPDGIIHPNQYIYYFLALVTAKLICPDF
jgi:lysophospholipase L1-like esterase